MTVSVLILFVLPGIYATQDTIKSALQSPGMFQKLVEKVETMETKLNKLEHLESRMAKMESVIQSQKDIIRNQSRKLKRFEKLLSRLNSKEPRNEEPVGFEETKGMDTESRNKKRFIGERGIREADLSPDFVSMTTSERSRRAAVGISFSAVMTHSPGHMGEHQMVVYDKILINDGNGYNEYSGMFTSPVPGVYLFIYHVGVENTQAWLHLMVNGRVMNAATAEAAFGAHGVTGSQDLQGSNTVIVRLSQGDSVWVEAFDAKIANTLFGTRLLNSFSGTLLY